MNNFRSGGKFKLFFQSLKLNHFFIQQFGAYPWQTVILAPGDVYQGSGALIDHLHVITAAHRVNEFM